MDFFVVIPAFNAADKIERTLRSLIRQTSVLDGQDSFRCLVCDGASTDGTPEAVAQIGDERITVQSEPDSGMYDALAKGLRQAEGDVTCYLPAGETLNPAAFSVLSEVFGRYAQIGWLTGRSVTCNERKQVTDSFLPHPYRRNFIDCGMYGTRLPCIQQESTFWRTELNREFDLDALRACTLAGDYFLWRSLARTQDLYVVNTDLGAFTIETGQLSQQQPGAYRREMRQLRRPPRLSERAAALLLRLRTKHARPRKNAPRQVSYDHASKIWRLSR
ncbi:glycosyltransferase [Roseovarius spongiae]|uniref:Glycosyltransferase n=1 Tax=Roseovarius spongiae TaxID=2320272 RepID=A0A3A8AU53_9RHOB|nr:glycosyltransferase [Roseovarius spongiae]RKF15179.1 glycosyltransferase [Roseovarius spongiae]